MTVVSSNIQQAIDALQAERADLQQKLEWVDARIAEFTQAAPRTPMRAPTPRRERPSRQPQQRGGSMRAMVIGFIKEHPDSTAGMIAAELGLKRNSVSTLLSQLRANGDLVKVERGYRVP